MRLAETCARGIMLKSMMSTMNAVTTCEASWVKENISGKKAALLSRTMMKHPSQ